jgi:hypothetical protein
VQGRFERDLFSFIRKIRVIRGSSDFGLKVRPRGSMSRIRQIWLIVVLVLCSWFGMQAVHELGHVLHAWLSGAGVTRVVLDPLQFSRTDVSPNPHPQFVAWGGAIWGCLIPLAAHAIARGVRWSGWYVLAFFAGFCLIANGGYLGAGALVGAGDAGDLIRSGAPQGALVLFGVVAAGGGLWLWNGLGSHFGLGPAPRPVSRSVAWGLTAVLFSMLLIECLWFR